MDYQDFQRHIGAIKQLISMIQVPGDEHHAGILFQIHQLLNNMNDECVNRAHQQEQNKTPTPPDSAQ